MDYKFRPELHPRNRLGRFIEVLGSLRPGDTVKLPDGVKVERRVGGTYRLTKRGGRRPVDTRSVDYAAKAGLTGLKEMSPQAKTKMTDRVRDSLLSTVEIPRKGPATPGRESMIRVRPAMSPGTEAIDPNTDLPEIYPNTDEGWDMYRDDIESGDMTPGEIASRLLSLGWDKFWDRDDNPQYNTGSRSQDVQNLIDDLRASEDSSGLEYTPTSAIVELGRTMKKKGFGGASAFAEPDAPMSPGTPPDETYDGAQKALLRATMMRAKALRDGDEASAAEWAQKRQAAQSALDAIKKEEGLPASPPEGMGMSASDFDSMKLGSEVVVKGEKWTKGLSDIPGADLGPTLPGSAWRNADGTMLFSADLAKRAAVSPPQSPGTGDQGLRLALNDLDVKAQDLDALVGDNKSAQIVSMTEELRGLSDEPEYVFSMLEDVALTARDAIQDPNNSEAAQAKFREVYKMAYAIRRRAERVVRGKEFMREVSPPQSPGTNEPIPKSSPGFAAEDAQDAIYQGLEPGDRVQELTDDPSPGRIGTVEDVRKSDLGDGEVTTGVSVAWDNGDGTEELTEPIKSLPAPPQSPGTPDFDDSYVIQDQPSGPYIVGKPGGKLLGEFSDFDEAIAAINADKEKDQYWPDTYYVNERGAVDLLDNEGNMISPPESPGLEDVADAILDGTPMPKPDAGDIKDKPLYELADEIRRDWKNVNFGAKPYLDALGSLGSVNDDYGLDPGRSIVAYFLSNARGWKGEKAKEIKAELKRRLSEGAKEPLTGWREILEARGVSDPDKAFD